MANPQRAGRDWPPVVVASGFQTGLNLMRDLGRHGVQAVGVDHDPENEGFRSIYGESHVCPHPAADEFVEELGRHPEALAEFYIFLASPPALQVTAATLKNHCARPVTGALLRWMGLRRRSASKPGVTIRV